MFYQSKMPYELKKMKMLRIDKCLDRQLTQFQNERNSIFEKAGVIDEDQPVLRTSNVNLD
jgi:hypothetical protein